MITCRRFSEDFIHSLRALDSFQDPPAKVKVIKIGCRLVSKDLHKLILNSGKFVSSTFGDHRSGSVEMAMPREVAFAVKLWPSPFSRVPSSIKSMYPRGEILIVRQRTSSGERRSLELVLGRLVSNS